MRIAYCLYASLMIFLLWGSYGDTTAKDMALKVALALWCVSLLTVALDTKYSQWFALAALIPLIGVLLLLTGSRVAFIFEHGGMDCVTCDASPMAFLLGWIAEGFFLILAIVFCAWLIRGTSTKS